MKVLLLLCFFIFNNQINYANNGLKSASKGSLIAQNERKLLRIHDCVSVFRILGPSHSIAGVSHNNSSAAYRAFKKFRREVLNIDIVEPRTRFSISVKGNTALKSEKIKIAKRIRDIEKNFLRVETPEDKKNATIVAGISLKGREKIEEFIKEFYDEISKIKEIQNNADLEPFPKTNVENQHGGLRKSRLIEALEEFLENKTPWVYSSINKNMNKMVVNDLWTLPEEAIQDNINTIIEADGPPKIYTFIMTKLLNFYLKNIMKIDTGNELKSSKVYIDQVAFRDPKTNEPVLSIFVRFGLKKPKAPKKRRKKPYRSPEYGEPMPVTYPVRKY